MKTESHDSAGSCIAGVVDRPRLYNLLDTRVPQICVVKGPSGIGKTTLLRSWVLQRAQTHPVLWITINPGNASRHSFWHQVTATARRHGDLTVDRAQEVAERLSLTTEPVAVAIEVLGDAGRVTMVIDAYEHLGEASRQLDSDLLRLTKAAPDLRVLIATRGNTDLDRDTYQLRSVSHSISERELALSTDEIRDLVVTHLGRDDPRLAASISRSTKGYALAVRAAVLALAGLPEVPRFDSVEWNTVVATDLEALLPDAEATRFLTSTSVPPYFDLDLARQLSDHPDVAGLLAFLERNGFGRWIPYAADRPVFQYVESIRDTFRRRAAADLRQARSTSGQVAAWLLANEDYDQSFQFAIDAEDHLLAEQVFLHLLVTNPESYISDRFLTSLQQVRSEPLDTHPMLAFALGLALLANPVLRSEAQRALERVLSASTYPTLVEPAFDAFCAASMKAVVLRLLLRFRESAPASHEAAQLTEAIEPELREQLGDYVGTVLRQLSYSLLQGGMIDEAITTMSRSAGLCVSRVARDYSIAYAAGAHAFAGNTAKARSVQLSIDIDRWPTEFRHSYMNALGLVAEGYLRLDAFDFTGALDVFRESDSYIQTAEFWPFLTGIGMTARLGLGQAAAEAERITAELASATPPPGTGDNVATEHLRTVLVFLWLAAGDPAKARAVVHGQSADRPHLAPARLGLLLDSGRYDRAIYQVPDLLRVPGHTIRSRTATQTLGAVAALRAGDESIALRLLHAAAVAYETYGTRAHLLYLAEHDHRLLVRFATESDQPGVEEFLRVPLRPGTASADRPIQLTGREQAVLRAVRDHGTTKEIAAALYVSPNTVKSQLRRIHRKLGVSSRQAAARMAADLGLLDESRP